MHVKPVIAARDENNNGKFGSSIRTNVFRWFCLIVVLPLSTAWSAQEIMRPHVDMDSVNIIPQSLGIPAGCDDSSPWPMNNGTFPGSLVIGGASNCGPSGYLPHTWQNGSWLAVELPNGVSGGYVESVSDDAGEPIMTLTLRKDDEDTAWVRMPGQLPVEPPLPAEMTLPRKLVVSSRGDHMVGSVFNHTLASRRAVRWARKGSVWLAPEDIGPVGDPVAISTDGSMVIGRAWVWTAKPAGGGDIVFLDIGAWANDITHNGSMIVGGRDKPCTNNKCGVFPVPVFPGPVYWVRESGQWRLHDLEALGGVDSEALAVAEVDGRPVIVGYGFNDGPMRPVVWLPQADGSYGAPLTLQNLPGGDCNYGPACASWAYAKDVNRHGDVIGISDRPANDWINVGVIWSLFGQSTLDINAGHSGVWYNPATSGQGLLLDVEPENHFIFLSWFTYTDADSAHPNEQHWFTAQGNYGSGTAELILYETLGGQFDNPMEVNINPVGNVNLSFTDCGAGTLDYSVEAWGLQGSFPISRAIPGAENVCLERSGSSSDLPGSNDGWDGAWYDSNSPGQGFLIDAKTSTEGADFIFVAWFTYGDSSASGQRWLTAQGPLQGTTADMIVYETTGGSFDQPTAVVINPVGSMIIEFDDCSNARLSYSLSDENLAGSIQIERAVPGTEALCQQLNGQNMQ